MDQLTIIPISGIPYAYRPVTNIVPFSEQDGSRYLEVLYDLKRFLNDTVITHINTEVGELAESWKATTEKLIGDVETQLAAQTADVDGKITSLEDYVDEAVNSIIGSTIVVVDPVMKTVIANLTSQTRVYLDTLYAGKSVQTLTETGRLSASALDNAYASKATQAAVETGRLSVDGLAEMLRIRETNEFLPYNYMTSAEKVDFESGARLLDSTPYIQKAITAAARAGGGTVNLPPGKLLNKSTLIMLSNVKLVGNGTTLLGRGSGLGTAIETGYLTEGGPVSNVAMFTDDAGTPSGNGDPIYHCSHAVIEGIRFDGYYMGARLHWWTGEGQVNRNWFTNISYRSVRGTFSWGSQYRGNTFESTLMLGHFVDWHIIEGNSFNAKNALGIGILIVNGGCWTTSIRNNGFHWHVVGEGTGIKFEGGARNVKIESNHFESNWRHIYGSAQTLQSLTITNNHFAATPVNMEYTKVKALEFLSLRDSFIGYNDFELGGVTVDAFDAKIILNTDSTFYNKVLLQSHPTNGIVDLAKCTIRSSNLVESFGGALFNTQPSLTPLAGTSGFTFEKYDAKYNFVANTLPACVVTPGTNTVTIDTFIDSDATGVLQPGYFFLRVGGGTTSYRVAGRIAGRFGSVVFDAKENYATGAVAPTVVLSNNAGKLRIVLSALADAVNNTSGFVKAI